MMSTMFASTAWRPKKSGLWKALRPIAVKTTASYVVASAHWW